jgi:hypothetical protein
LAQQNAAPRVRAPFSAPQKGLPDIWEAFPVIIAIFASNALPICFKMNKKQIAQLSLAGMALVLIVFWLIEPEWKAEKILGIISSALLILSMLLSYSAEEKLKKDKDKK